MTVIELLEMLTKRAKEYRKDTDSVRRNRHLTFLNENPSQDVIDAVLVDFINCVGVTQCCDYALDVNDLRKE